MHAVRGLDLRIRAGEVVALLGPNGAGKTTTLDIVLGLTKPTGGAGRVYGAEPREAVIAGRVSAVLQSGGLLRDLTVRETVELVGSLHPAARPVEEVLELAGLTDLGGRMVAKCSGGEQQRLRFALALLPDPDLLVLDEPTAGMDVKARRAFWATMHADADAGRTVVFATHYLEEADAFADRIVLMAQGRVVADGSTAEIRARATGRTVSATLPADDRDAALARLRARADVAEVEEHSDRVAGAQHRLRRGRSRPAHRARGFGARDHHRQSRECVPRHHRRRRHHAHATAARDGERPMSTPTTTVESRTKRNPARQSARAW